MIENLLQQSNVKFLSCTLTLQLPELHDFVKESGDIAEIGQCAIHSACSSCCIPSV